MENGDLRVWWIPQIPGSQTPGASLYIPVNNVDEAILVYCALVKYELFQFENKKAEHCDGGLQIFDDGEWYDWGSDDGREFEDILDDETTVRRFGGST